MSLIPWSEALDVQVEAMNSEHKLLLDAMNKLHDAWVNKLPYETQNKMIADLSKITVDHFANEEKYMAQINFPNLEVHKLLHLDLLAKYTEHVNQFKKNKNLTEEFVLFLKVWLKVHIQCIDIKYGEHSKKQAA